MDPIIKRLFKSISSVASLGRKVNNDNRQKIQNITGEICDELQRALDLADSYLRGVRFSQDDNELSNYLRNADGKLMTSYHEHHICAALYSLADRFGQLFDPVKLCVDTSAFKEIPKLIDSLKFGERAILDDLDEMVRDLSDTAYEFDQAIDEEKETQREIILGKIEVYRSELKAYKSQIKDLHRSIVDKM